MVTGGYAYGDWVTYKPDYMEVGRVGRYAGDGFICFHDGCTAAKTPMEDVRPATQLEVAGASPRIGHHRFDHECPDFDPECCQMCVHATDGGGGAR